MSDELSELPKTTRDKAELLVQMTKEAKRVERRTGASACIVICLFEEKGQLLLQDAGQFPMPPEQFYAIMQQAHNKGMFAAGNKRKIIKPH